MTANYIKHSFTSAKDDDEDDTLVRPSDWNADHVDSNGNPIDLSSLGGTVTANFSVDTSVGDYPLTVTFTNTSINAVNYLWEFGDGTTSIEENPVHVYEDLGIYTIRLIVETNGVYGIKTLKDYIITTTTPSGETYNLNWLTNTLNGWTVEGDATYPIETGAFGHYDIQCNGEGLISYPLALSNIEGSYSLRQKVYSASFSDYIELRIYNSSNYYALKKNINTGVISLYKHISGTNTTISTASSPVTVDTSPHILELIIDVDGDMTAKHDGTTVLTGTDTSITASTKVGIYSTSNGGYPEFDYLNIEINSSSTPPNIEHILTTPILSHGSGEWNGLNVGCPRIILIDNERRMYHLGESSGLNCGIGYAVEGNNISSFYESPNNPISNLGSNIRIGSIIKIGDTYYLYYGTEPASNIYLATSTDGITWTASGSNPILSPSGAETNINLPYVILSGSTYYMYYTNYVGGTSQPNQYKVASSSNGISWTKVGTVLDKGTSGWDSSLTEDKSVFEYNGTFYLFYEGYNGSEWCIGLATNTSPTGTFTKSSNNPILSPSGTVGAFDRYQVATPQLYNINGNMFLLYQGGNNATYGSASWDIGLVYIRDITLL